jgi:hypothetical protein
MADCENASATVGDFFDSFAFVVVVGVMIESNIAEAVPVQEQFSANE